MIYYDDYTFEIRILNAYTLVSGPGVGITVVLYIEWILSVRQCNSYIEEYLPLQEYFYFFCLAQRVICISTTKICKIFGTIKFTPLFLMGKSTSYRINIDMPAKINLEKIQCLNSNKLIMVLIFNYFVSAFSENRLRLFEHILSSGAFKNYLL